MPSILISYLFQYSILIFYHVVVVCNVIEREAFTVIL